jgi:coenzyme F420-reducing hydrogenase beta subunit
LESNKKPLFSDLYNKVISRESICSSCGACVLICPKNRLVFKNFKPEQVSGDKNVCPEDIGGRCGLCAIVCPRLNREYRSFNSEKDAIGNYISIVAGRATDLAFRKKGQDGGLVSSIFKWGLLSKRWSSFVSYTRDENWKILPLVVTESNEVIKTCGSKYTYTSIIDGLSQLHKLGLSSKPFAIVGLPCHITAIRKLKQLRSKYMKGLALCIGLFCSKAFSYEGLIKKKLMAEMKIPISDVKKMDIRKGLFTIEMDSGMIYETPVKELQNYSHSGCSACVDFSAESADISVGGLGLSEWTIAVIRTKLGEGVVKAAGSYGMIDVIGAEEFPKALLLLERLSSKKREQAEKK